MPILNWKPPQQTHTKVQCKHAVHYGIDTALGSTTRNLIWRFATLRTRLAHLLLFPVVCIRSSFNRAASAWYRVGVGVGIGVVRWGVPAIFRSSQHYKLMDGTMTVPWTVSSYFHISQQQPKPNTCNMTTLGVNLVYQTNWANSHYPVNITP